MSSESFFGSGALDALRSVMDLAAARQRTYAKNAANVSTPGYQRRDVSAEESFRQVLSRTVRLAATHPAHMSGPERHQSPLIEAEDGSGQVDIDKELVALGETQLRFKLAARLAALRIGALRSSIRGGS